MAFSFDTSIYFSGTANPLTQTYTCGAGTTLLVLDIGTEVVAGGIGRAPAVNPLVTFSGARMPQIDISRGTGGEAKVEMFALSNPSTGVQYTVSIPNTGGIILNCHLSSYKTTAGNTSVLDVSSGYTSASGKVNVSTNITTSTTNELFVNTTGNGAAAAMVSCFPGQFITPILDKGNCQNEAQWGIIPTATNTRIGMITNATPGISGLLTGVWFEQPAIPFVPRLSYPANNTINASINATFAWTSVNAGPTAASYVFHRSTDITFLTTDISVAGITNLYYFANNPSMNYTTDYYWRVAATNATGTSAFTPTYKVTTGSATSIKTVAGMAYADIKAVSGMAKASISEVAGLV